MTRGGVVAGRKRGATDFRSIFLRHRSGASGRAIRKGSFHAIANAKPRPRRRSVGCSRWNVRRPRARRPLVETRSPMRPRSTRRNEERTVLRSVSVTKNVYRLTRRVSWQDLDCERRGTITHRILPILAGIGWPRDRRPSYTPEYNARRSGCPVQAAAHVDDEPRVVSEQRRHQRPAQLAIDTMRNGENDRVRGG